MIDKNRIKEALKICSEGCNGEGCSYNEEACCDMFECRTCVQALTGDALELIDHKAKPKFTNNNYLSPYCGNCGYQMPLEPGTLRKPRFCSRCGTEVDWK